jgi:hypothetical protein
MIVRRNFHLLTEAFVLLAMLGLGACENGEDAQPVPTPEKIFYSTDGRRVFVGDLDPIALDLTRDGTVDYTIFAVLTADASGDHLYVGINPIGANLIKSGLPDDSHFMNMGFLEKEDHESTINSELAGGQIWTSEHNMLVLRHTYANATKAYEGNWQNESEAIVAIQYVRNQVHYYGWLKLQFDKATEYITLIDYAFNQGAGKSIKSGQKE